MVLSADLNTRTQQVHMSMDGIGGHTHSLALLLAQAYKSCRCTIHGFGKQLHHGFEALTTSTLSMA